MFAIERERERERERESVYVCIQVTNLYIREQR